MDQKNASLMITAACLILIFAIGAASAYTISKNRIKYVPAGLNETRPASIIRVNGIPEMIILDKEDIAWVLECKSMKGGVGYQSGYDDACDDFRALLSLKTSKFRAAPSPGILAPGPKYSHSFPINAFGYFPINASLYRFEYVFNGSKIWPIKNVTVSEIRVYPIK